MRAHALASTPPPLPPPSDNKQGGASDDSRAPYDDSGPAAVVSLSTQGRQLMGLFGANTVAPLAVTGPAAPSGEEQTPSGLALGVAKDQASEAELYAMLQDARVAEAAPREAKPQLNEMTEDEQRYLRELQQRDREVRAHEAAHQSAGGSLTGGASFSFVTGPDGQQYAVGGEVSIDMSEGNTPEETIARAQQIRAAALAPADPSGQDRAVAASASRMEAAALKEQAEQMQAELDGTAEVGEKQSSGAPGLEAASAQQDPRSPWDVAPKSRHSHLQTDCGFCGRAAAAFAK